MADITNILVGATNYTVNNTLSGLTDTTITSPAEGQILVRSGTKWVNGNIAGANVQPLIYSTEEREVGVWTDGKPLYQRTFEVANPTQSVIATGQTYDMAIVVGGYYILSDGNSMLEVNQFLSTANYAYVHVEKDGDIQYKISGYSATKLVVTIQYTKTTDTAGSGTWTPSGIPAVHYSTEEQVVGTWIDGSTVYEKTIVNTLTLTSSWQPYFDTTGIDTIVDVKVRVDRSGEEVAPVFSLYAVATWLRRNGYINVSLQGGESGWSILSMTVQYTKTAATRSLSAPVTALKADISDDTKELEDLSTDTETSLTKANTEETLSEMETTTEGTEDED